MIVFIIFFAAGFIALSIGIIAISWALRLALFVFRIICHIGIGLIAWLTPQREPEPPAMIDLRWNRLRRRWE